MDEKEINNLVEKKILEAKLDISDKRFNYLVILAGGLLAIFGLIFPIWQANTSTEKVDKAIEEMRTELKLSSEKNEKEISRSSIEAKEQLREMISLQSDYLNMSSDQIEKEIQSFESRFKELAGTQLRKPILICQQNGRTIGNSQLTFNNNNTVHTFELKNIGEATAKNIFAKIYLSTDKDIQLWGNFERQYYSDEPTYNKVYVLNSLFDSIDPKDSKPFDINISNETKGSIVVPALLKIYYEQPEPIVYNFTIKIDSE